MCCYRLDELVGYALGLNVHDAKPGICMFFCKPFEQVRQRSSRLKVGSPTASILCDEHDFPYALAYQP